MTEEVRSASQSEVSSSDSRNKFLSKPLTNQRPAPDSGVAIFDLSLFTESLKEFSKPLRRREFENSGISSIRNKCYSLTSFFCSRAARSKLCVILARNGTVYYQYITMHEESREESFQVYKTVAKLKNVIKHLRTVSLMT